MAIMEDTPERYSADCIYHFADGHMKKLFDGAEEYSQEGRYIYTANEQVLIRNTT